MYISSVKNLSDQTIQSYLAVSGRFFKFIQDQLKIPFENVDKKAIHKYILWNKERGISNHTINKEIRTLKLLFKFAKKEGYIQQNPMLEIDFVKTENKIKRVLSIDDMRKVLNGVNGNGFTKIRDKTFIIFLFDSLVRISEALLIRVEDVDLKTGLIKVFGKERKERMVPVGFTAKRELHRYLNTNHTLF